MQFEDIPEAKAWLELFTGNDASSARLLLNRLRLISADYFDYSIKTLVLEVANKCKGPIALYAAREVESDEEYFPDKRRRPVVIEGQPGSEGQLGYTVTQISRSDPSRFLNHPPITTLRKKRCHDIVIIDDVIGSGHRVTKFLKCLRKERSFYSWISLGLLKFHIIAFAVNKKAESKIYSVFKTNRSKKPSPIVIYFQERPIADSSTFPPYSLSPLRDFCKKFGKKYKIDPIYYTGYDDNMATTIFAHKCPNNVPGILWWNKNSEYKPLFSGTFVSPSILRGFFTKTSDYSANPSHILFGVATRSSIMSYMRALGRKLRTIDQISAATGLNRLTIEDTKRICLANGWINGNGYLTEQGRNELRRDGRPKEKSISRNLVKYEYYFPKSLRAARGAI